MKLSIGSRTLLPPKSAFAGFRFPAEVIVVAVRWYLRYHLSYRDIEELLVERGIEVEGPRIFRTENPLRFFSGREVVHVT